MIDQNTRFLVYLRKMEDRPAGLRLIHIHVSELPAIKKSRENLSKAISVFADIKNKSLESEIFLLKNLDIIFVARDINKDLLATSGDSIRKIFIGNMGVTFKNTHGGKGEFYTLFDLSYELGKIMAWAESAAGIGEVNSGGDNAPSKATIDLKQLNKIKEGIQRIDMASILYNQPVYNIKEDGKASLMFEEMYISVQRLESLFCPGVSLTQNKWLFNDLTEELDTIVLRLLANPEERGNRKRMSLNVNLSSLASNKFVTFDAELPIDSRQGVVLEINKTDVFENMNIYNELVPFLRRRGYKILLDGLSFENVAALDFDGIICDFAKIFWSGALAANDDVLNEKTRAKLKNRKNPLLVLARCDTAQSLRFAKEMGIKLVQGRLVDHMVKRSIPF